jgi:hypothetical protein
MILKPIWGVSADIRDLLPEWQAKTETHSISIWQKAASMWVYYFQISILNFGFLPCPKDWSKSSNIYVCRLFLVISKFTERNRTRTSCFYRVKCRKVRANHEWVTDRQSYYHHPNTSSWKTSKRPKNVHSWLESIKKMAAAKHQSKSPNSRIPKLDNTDRHIDCKQIKGALITITNASLCPHAMMI